MNANIKHLEKIHGKHKAESAFREIADLGGYGSVGGGEGSIPVNHAGGLDVAGVLAESNTAVSSKSKERIAELMGVDRKTADIVSQGGGQSSAAKMRSQEK